MKQTLHIFKKDVRFLWKEIVLLALLAAIFGWLQAHGRNPLEVELVLALAAINIIARLVHAETIPGDNQFWITRPYRWRSLLGAKLLFILVCVNLPIFAARLYVLVTEGFPLAAGLPGLLWSQLLMIVAASLPLAALAAVTTGLAPFSFALLILVTLAFGVQEMMRPSYLPGVRILLRPAQWFWDTIAVIALVAAAVPALFMQYRDRRTFFSRMFSIGLALVATLAYLYMPWTSALAVQTLLSDHPESLSSAHLALDAKGLKRLPMGKQETGIRLSLPLAVQGLPEGIHVEADGLDLEFRGSDARVWRSGPYRYQGVSRSGTAGAKFDGMFDGSVVIDTGYFEAERGKPVSLRASLYVTLFGNTQTQTIPIQNTRTNLLDGLQCGDAGIFHQYYCRAPFRWPQRLVYAQFWNVDLEQFQRAPIISYSPFPADLSLDAEDTRTVTAPADALKVTIISKDVLAHVRLDLEVPNVRW